MAENTTADGAQHVNELKRWRPVSPIPLLATAVLAVTGALVPLYSTANTDLSGPRFLLAVLLGVIALALAVEGFNRSRAAEPWRTIAVVGALAGLASIVLVLLPVSRGDAASGDGGLRFSLEQTGPEFFDVAFKRPIPLPSTREGWAQLHRRGGVDVGSSRFHLTLANEGSAPISVRNIRAEVLGSEPMPHGTLAWRYSQGQQGLGELAMLLPNGRRGSVGRLYEGSVHTLDPKTLLTKPPYFQTDYISLEPGEVYPATLTVAADTARTIEYRLIAEGESAERHFVVHTPVYRLVGHFEDPYQRRFARYYAKGHDPSVCTPTPANPWVDAHHANRSQTCPHGLGTPYDVPLPRPSRYPPGHFELSLGLTRGDQSATINDVAVGSAPAARPVPGVVAPLLSSLGAWNRCTEYSPNTGYWTAYWERWRLELTFASEDATDCTPASPAGVSEIDLGEGRATVHTNLGPVEIGLPPAQLPRRIEQLVEVEKVSYVRERVIPGVSACDPTRPVPARTQLSEGRPGGILAFAETLRSTEVLGVTTTLPPAGDC